MSNEIGIIKHMWTAILQLDFMLQLKLKVAMGRHSSCDVAGNEI